MLLAGYIEGKNEWHSFDVQVETAEDLDAVASRVKQIVSAKNMQTSSDAIDATTAIPTRAPQMRRPKAVRTAWC